MKYGVKGVTVQVYKVLAKVAEVNTKALNIKLCQPQQKHGWAKPEAKCIFI